MTGGIIAITPTAAEQRRQRSIPGVVVLVVNDLIVESLRGGQAVVKQEDILARLEAQSHLKRGEALSKGWLDFEEIYQTAGWDVSYDKPGFNESYEPSFTFTKRA